jgi:2-hydroxy-6-oxonona-2,4-dienedioate hydrolase
MQGGQAAGKSLGLNRHSLEVKKMQTISDSKIIGGARRAAVATILLLILSVVGIGQTAKLRTKLGLAGHAGERASVAQDAAVADKWATVYGVKIHYLEAGSGPVVMLLHGLGGDVSNWAANIGPLSQKYRVIVPDQIGFGKSDKPLINYRVATLVDFLDGFYKQLGVTRASLVGNSLGGWTVAAYALAHPEKVDRLVLVDAAGFAITGDLDPRVINGLNPSTRDAMKQVMGLVFYNKQMFESEAAVDALFARKIAAGDGYTIQRFIDSITHGEDVLDEKLGAVKQPTLIVWGREDGLTPLAMGERFNKEIAGSQLLVIEKCGHVPQLEKSAEFNAALIKFLGGADHK